MRKSSLVRFIGNILGYFITLVLYMAVTRHILFLAVNHEHMGEDIGTADIMGAILHGLILDIFAACVLSIVPFFLMAARMYRPSFSTRPYMLVYNALISLVVPLIILSNASLFYFWDSLLDVSALTFLNDPDTAFASVSTGYLWGRFAIWMVLSALMFGALYWSGRPGRTVRPEVSKPHPAAATVAALVVAALIFVGIRGTNNFTLNPADAYFSEHMFCNHMTTNPVMNMVYSAAHRVDLRKKYHRMPDEECEAMMLAMMPDGEGETEMLLTTARPNILLIIVESLTATTMPSLYPDGELAVATGLDSLANTGIFFPRYYCDSYQTDQAMPGILNGVHILRKIRPFRDETRTKQLPSLARSLAREGYSTQFAYGGDVHFLNMYSYLEYTGYETILSGRDFPKEEKTSCWGIPDGVMLDHVYDMMQSLDAEHKEPYFLTLLTLSSHNPFDVPLKGAYTDPAQNAYAYTDRSLTTFIDRLRRSEMWDDLLVVITGDHGPHEHAKATPYYSHTVLMMLGGVVKEPVRIDKIMAQHDLPATLLAQLGIGHDDFVMSRNVMSDTYSYPFAINTFDDGFTYVDNTGVTIYDNARNLPLSGDDAKRITSAKAFEQYAAEYYESLKSPIKSNESNESNESNKSNESEM